jgi:hypothetical protein
MAMTVRRKRALARGVRSTIFEVCLSAGVLIALWWGIKHPEHVARCATGHEPASHVIQHCVSNTIGTVASHWALTLGAGAIIGALVGAALASLIRIPQRA